MSNHNTTATAVKCQGCGRVLREGESAWASDWKVFDVGGTTATIRTETRYTCDDCEPVSSTTGGAS